MRAHIRTEKKEEGGSPLRPMDQIPLMPSDSIGALIIQMGSALRESAQHSYEAQRRLLSQVRQELEPLAQEIAELRRIVGRESLSLDDVSQRTGISKKVLYKAIRTGMLKAYKAGGNVRSEFRVMQSDLDTYIKSIYA